MKRVFQVYLRCKNNLSKVRTACSNCTECPQFISIPGHVLCAYCGCPPARHGKGPATSSTSQGERKRGRPRDSSQDSLASTAPGRSTPSDSDQSDSDETSSGVSSFASGRQRRARRWRPSWQVTAPPPRVSRLLAEEAASHEEVKRNMCQISHKLWGIVKETDILWSD